MTIDLWLSVLLICCSSDLLPVPMDRFDPIGSCLNLDVLRSLILVAVDFDVRTHGHRLVEITDYWLFFNPFLELPTEGFYLLVQILVRLVHRGLRQVLLDFGLKLFQFQSSSWLLIKNDSREKENGNMLASCSTSTIYVMQDTLTWKCPYGSIPHFLTRSDLLV